MKFFVYILECEHKKTKRITYYTGYSKDWQERLKAHKKGQGARYTRTRNLALKHLEEYDTQLEAMRREQEIKKLGHADKKCLFTINTNHKNNRYKKLGNNKKCPICGKLLRSSIQSYSIKDGWNVKNIGYANPTTTKETYYSCTALDPCILNVSASLLKSYTKRMKGEIK